MTRAVTGTCFFLPDLFLHLLTTLSTSTGLCKRLFQDENVTHDQLHKIILSIRGSIRIFPSPNPHFLNYYYFHDDKVLVIEHVPRPPWVVCPGIHEHVTVLGIMNQT